MPWTLEDESGNNWSMMRSIVKLTGMLMKRLLTLKLTKRFWIICGIFEINLTKLKVSFKTDECSLRGVRILFRQTAV